jgi:FSR family fosmidomycin resistance protein-like MFS transporter
LATFRHWDYAAASGITVAATVLSSIVQPLFGLLTDYRRAPWLVPLGMSVAGAGIGLSGLSHSYRLTWLAIALSGVGSPPTTRSRPGWPGWPRAAHTWA